jgi:hypothetical protein
LAAVEAIIGKADHDLRGGRPDGRVAWNISFSTKKTTTHINIYIDFGEDWTIVKRMDTERRSKYCDSILKPRFEKKNLFRPDWASNSLIRRAAV